MASLRTNNWVSNVDLTQLPKVKILWKAQRQVVVKALCRQEQLDVKFRRKRVQFPAGCLRIFLSLSQVLQQRQVVSCKHAESHCKLWIEAIVQILLRVTHMNYNFVPRKVMSVCLLPSLHVLPFSSASIDSR